MKFATKFVEEVTNENGQTFIRLEAFVNHKKQGTIIGIKSTPEEYKKTQEKYSAWKVEGDPFPNNTYPTDDDAIVALCNKNGRKLKLDKDGNIKKRK